MILNTRTIIIVHAGNPLGKIQIYLSREWGGCFYQIRKVNNKRGIVWAPTKDKELG